MPIPSMKPNAEDFRAAGFTANAADHPRDEIALRLLCAFNGVDPRIAPPTWWFHPCESSKEAWKRVADEAERIYAANDRAERMLAALKEPSDDTVEKVAKAMFEDDPVFKDSAGNQKWKWEDVTYSNGPYLRKKAHAALAALHDLLASIATETQAQEPGR